jgi:uncharacterized DUF497 family protein
MMNPIDFSKVTGFDWDKGNIEKSFSKHGVSITESEQLFFNNPFLILQDVKHSHIEERYHGLGRTDLGRLLFVVFTLREQKVRIISCRDMNKKERAIYMSDRMEKYE